MSDYGMEDAVAMFKVSMRMRVLELLVVLAVPAAVWAAPPPDVDTSTYGIDQKTGVFVHPQQAPYAAYRGPRPVKGSLPYLEQKDYIHNMKVLGHWPIIVRPGHTWQHIVDLDGRRYMFHYYRQRLNVYDITDPLQLKVILEKQYEDGSWFGAARIAYNRKLGKWIMLQSFEVPRSVGGLEGHKYDNPQAVAQIVQRPGLRGFRVYELLGPTQWKLLSEVSMDQLRGHTDVQGGPGALDVPNYEGGKYAFFLGAPDNTFVHMESANQIYSAMHMIYDMEDPVAPRLISGWWVPGQRLGEEEAYRAWPQFGNQTSWTGGRLPMMVPVQPENGGKYAYTAVGALGFYVLDISNPGRPQTMGHLDLPFGVGGHEGDNVDAARAVERGIVLVNGYPMNEDCYEPYKDVYLVDVKDPAKPTVVSVLPRPKPPKGAPYTDFCLRRGKFGPKRSGPVYAPGVPDPNIVVYPYNSGGIQVFDISNVKQPKIVAYYVPPMGGDFKKPETYNTPVDSVHMEWDRKLIWAFTTNGMYLLSTPALGKPVLTAPAKTAAVSAKSAAIAAH